MVKRLEYIQRWQECEKQWRKLAADAPTPSSKEEFTRVADEYARMAREALNNLQRLAKELQDK